MRLSELTISLVLAFTPLQLQAVVVLSEIMYDPNGEESSDEFVELYNDAALPIQLAGWTISDGEGVDTLVNAGQGLTAAPRQYVLILDSDYIEDGSITYDGLVPENALIVTISNGTFGSRGLSNSSGETISIQNASGSLVGEYRYSVGNESGHSDEKIRLSQNNDSTNWHDSAILHGTPGFRNSVTPPDRDLGIIGLHAAPDYPASSSMYQIEVYVMNIGLQSLGTVITFSADSIGFGEFYLLRTTELTSIAAGDCTMVADSIVMPQTGIQQIRAELELADDDSNNNVMTVLVSSEALEAGIRINEIQYVPTTGRAEWIELAIAATLPVSTRGMKISDGQGIGDTTARAQLPDWVIQPGEFVVITTDSAIFLEDIPLETRVTVLSNSEITLNNNGDSIAIFAPGNVILERIDYRPNWGNSGAGVSLERVSLESPTNNETNWGSSVDPHGSTLGRINSRGISDEQTTTSLSVSPSPFTPNGDGLDEITEIRFSTEHTNGINTIKIFDTRGRLVNIFSVPTQGNTGSVLWDGRSDNGELVATARYIVLLESENSSGEVSVERTTIILARPK